MAVTPLNIAHLHRRKKMYELHGFTNILQLENPNGFDCHLIEYKVGLSVLQIRIYEPNAYEEKFFVLEIVNLFYLACPKQ